MNLYPSTLTIKKSIKFGRYINSFYYFFPFQFQRLYFRIFLLLNTFDNCNTLPNPLEISIHDDGISEVVFFFYQKL